MEHARVAAKRDTSVITNVPQELLAMTVWKTAAQDVLIIPVTLLMAIALGSKHCLQKKTTEKEETERRRNSNKGVTQTDFIGTDSKPSSSGHGNKIIKTENKKSKKCQKKNDEADVDDDEKIHSENPYGDFYANETTIRDIPLNQLESVIAEKRMNKDDGFQREYASLPYGEQYKCDEGRREENVVKNRYKTIFPYDHSRVILRTEQTSGYINANYIEGAHRQNEYVAAQGPTKNTLADFWTMIWQGNVSSIVMLTNLQEGTKIKCCQYWPDVRNKNNYGALSVKMTEEKKYAFHISRRMIVSHNETKKSRSVNQYHYTAWPDYGIPDPLCLVVFLDHVTRTGTNQNSSPTVVHCSAGIGRTGTYIALDVLNQIGKKTGKVNVAEYVKKMRESRMNMVQTYEQYMTIYLALNEIFKSRVDTITLEDFTKKMAAITTDIPANQNILRKEFQILMKIRPVYNDADFKIAKGICRNGSSFTKSKAFIVTQYPTVEDFVDFLCLLYDQESDIVIFMDPQRTTEPMMTLFPTTSFSKTVPPFTVHLQSKTETDSKKDAHTVTIVEPKSRIIATGTSPDTSQLRSVVSVALGVETENPIIVVSSDGASLCGAFCAVHNVIQQINMDDNVDVFTSVRKLQVRRPEFCFSLDEYGLVNKAVNDHIERSAENIYSNQ
ncbi:receptor-type tyrosine-protein phosphatase alpha-like [Saccostrea echinata]|uniref:receptor-type tyrosine-protein phosphatase alpha-like n=1 Tax=Saccostrea echinata TaxID=191078 RepID=UPI002A819FAD|nr:receptor-type tyrosine-protein phosphatase alpha-like [Saccostrea echinata]